MANRHCCWTVAGAPAGHRVSLSHRVRRAEAERAPGAPAGVMHEQLGLRVAAARGLELGAALARYLAAVPGVAVSSGGGH